LSNNIIFLFLPDACAGIAKVAVDGGYDVDDEQKSSFDSKIQYTITKIDKFSNDETSKSFFIELFPINC
jgi:hypothetical protein